MTARDLAFISIGALLTIVGISASFLGSIELGLTALFLLGMLLLFLLILQRRHQSRVQERILYLVNAERKRKKPDKINESSRESSSAEVANAVAAKKIIGILQAQQISMERLLREIKNDSVNCTSDTP